MYALSYAFRISVAIRTSPDIVGIICKCQLRRHLDLGQTLSASSRPAFGSLPHFSADTVAQSTIRGRWLADLLLWFVWGLVAEPCWGSRDSLSSVVDRWLGVRVSIRTRSVAVTRAENARSVRQPPRFNRPTYLQSCLASRVRRGTRRRLEFDRCVHCVVRQYDQWP